MRTTDLNQSDPLQVAAALRNAADIFEESYAELQAAWQDPDAGRVWHEIAKVLERAACGVDKVLEQHWR